MTNRIEKMFYKKNKMIKNIKIKKELRSVSIRIVEDTQKLIQTSNTTIANTYEKTIIVNNNKLIDVQDDEFIELDNYLYLIDNPNPSYLYDNYILIAKITFDNAKNNIFYYDIYIYSETNGVRIYDINGESLERNNKTKEEIILFFNKFLQDDYGIITLFCLCCSPDDDDFTNIINRYLNDKLNNSNTNLFNYLDEDNKFKLIYNRFMKFGNTEKILI